MFIPYSTFINLVTNVHPLCNSTGSEDYIIYQENNCKASIEQREIAKDYHDYEKSLLNDIENR